MKYILFYILGFIMFYNSSINLVDHTIRIGDIIFGLLGIFICVYARIKMKTK